MKIFDKIEKVNIDDIFPYHNNPKTHPAEQIDKLCSSIKNYGFTVPIVIDGENEIIAGHGRYKAAQKLGLEELPVIRRDDLTDAEAKALRIADNKVAESEWDMEMLEVEFEAIEDEFTGFELEELDFQTEEVEEDDFAEEVDEEREPITKLGDVIELGRHRLVCGDSTNKDDVDKLMNGDKADMVFTDPPYNALKSWNKDESKTETRLDPNKWFKNDNMTWPEFYKFIEDAVNNFSGHSTYICCDFRIYDRVKQVIDRSDYKLKHCIVWKKNVWGLGKRYRFQHEFIVYATKEKAPFTGDRSQSDVWEVDVDRTTEHNTPKPIELPYKAINNSSKKDNIVLDLFLGSGSTLIAAEQLNRKCYGMELNEHYCDLIINRYINYKLDKDEEINIKINGKTADYNKFLE